MIDSYPGVYRAKCVSDDGRVVRAFVPTLFGDTVVSVAEVVGPRPGPASLGWVALEAGDPAYPVWFSSIDSPGLPSSAFVWTDYTPVIQQGAVVVPTAVSYAKYVRMGAVVVFQGLVTATDDGDNEKVSVSLPVTAAVANPALLVGNAKVASHAAAPMFLGTVSTAEIPAHTLNDGETITWSIVYPAA